MKQTKFWSCLIAVILLVTCAAGIFAVGADAETATVYYTVGDVEMDGAQQFGDITSALDAAEAKSHQWAANDVLEIRFQGTISAGSQDGLVFGQTTIWREDGTKLPIIIRGVDTEKARDAYIYVDSAGGWYACANDYHFKNLTIPIGNQSTDFYAGSGNISFENVYFTNQNVKIRDSEDQSIMTQLIHDVARAVSARNNADLIPAGDAWQDLLDNNPDVGSKLWYSKKNPFSFGDYQHDGDLGGGQYLNACVWYEVLTKTSCVGNTWRPTAELCGYTLDEDLVVTLQNAAHAAVVAHYGEAFYDASYSPDTIKDNEINVLVIGSSTGYYFPDEVSQLLNAAGFTARVGMAYHSGVRLETQWSWAKSGTGDYAFRLYEANSVTATVNSGNGAMFKNVGFDSFIELYDWDAIGIYQAPGAFDDDISLDAYQACLATCDVADDLYAFYKKTNPDARYLWYQGATKAVGYPGLGTLTETSGRFFGDTCTQAVFAGWPELKDGERVQTSITFLDGTDYYSSARKHFIAAIGYMNDYTGEALTHETAAEVTYMEASSGYSDLPDIRPMDVDASIVIDGETARLYNVAAHLGHAPSNGTVHLKQGTVYTIDGDNRDSSVVDDYYGDMILKVSGGKVLTSVYGTYSSNVIGDLVIDISQDTAETSINASIRGTFDTGVVSGDVRMTVRGGTILGNNDNHYSFYGGGNCTGQVVNTISGGTLEGTYFGVRSGSPQKVTNNFTGGVINGNVYGGHFEKNSTIAMITNNVSGTVINGSFYGGGYSATGQKINAGTTVVDGKTVQASVVNNISGGTFNGYTDADGVVHSFYGSGKGGTCYDVYNVITGGTFAGRCYGTGLESKRGSVTNMVTGGTFNERFFGTGAVNNEGDVFNEISGKPVFEAGFFGSYSEGTVGNVSTRVSGSPTFKATFYAMGYDADVASSAGKTLTTTISGGTFKGKTYLCGQILRNRVATNTVSGGTFEAITYFGAYNSLAKEINTTVKGGTFHKYVYGGSYGATKNVDVKKITTTIEGGTFKGTFYGGNDGYKAGDIHNIVKGGTFASFVGGSNAETTARQTTISITSITNEILGGTFTNVYCGTRFGTVESIVNTVDGAQTSAKFYCGYGGTVGSIENTIKSVTTGDSLYMGNHTGGSTCSSIASVIENATVAGSLYCGSGSGTTGKIRTTIKNCDVKTYTYVSGDGIIEAPEGFTEDYLVECQILGGTFKGVWGGGAGSTSVMTGDVKVTVRGGTFNLYDANSSARQNALSAGGRNKKLIGDADVFIYGGTFNGEVIAGACPNSSGADYIHTDEGTHTVTVYGGTFNKPLLANSKWGSVTNGKMILVPTESDIIINSTMVKRTGFNHPQEFEIVGGDHKILLGKDAKIEATAASGTLLIEQAEGWKKQDYVTLPQGNTATVTVSTASGATGTYSIDRVGDSVVTVKGGVQLFGATMILTDRIAVRALFDKAAVEGDDFSFSFVMNGKELAGGTKADLEPWGENYYSIVLAKVGANDFTDTVTFSGSEMVYDAEFSIQGLAVLAETAWAGNEKGVALAKAIQNFAGIVAGEELPHDLTPAKVEGFTASASKGEGTLFTATNKGLVMTSAVGIRIYGTATEEVTAENLAITVNGKDVTEKAVIGAGENAGEYTIDLYVNAKNMSDPLNIVISEKATGKACLTLTDRVDAIAAAYGEDHKVAQQLLVYIQAAVEYASAL